MLSLFLAFFLCAEGFVVVPRKINASSIGVANLPTVSSQRPVATMNRSMQLWKTKAELDDLQGTKAGVVILTFVMVIILWGFTIPPSIRRSTICTDDRCLPNRSRCYDCKTLGELKKEVEDYYAGGGGIKWDFSVDPNNPFLPENIGK